jgi:hypothetical protein
MPRQNSQEDFDFSNITTSDEETAPAKKNRAPPPPVAAPGPATTVVNPVVKPPGRSNRAQDIDLFFDRGKGKKSICKHCR